MLYFLGAALKIERFIRRTLGVMADRTGLFIGLGVQAGMHGHFVMFCRISLPLRPIHDLRAAVELSGSVTGLTLNTGLLWRAGRMTAHAGAVLRIILLKIKTGCLFGFSSSTWSQHLKCFGMGGLLPAFEYLHVADFTFISPDIVFCGIGDKGKSK